MKRLILLFLAGITAAVCTSIFWLWFGTIFQIDKGPLIITAWLFAVVCIVFVPITIYNHQNEQQ